jgi:hypothetical protein
MRQSFTPKSTLQRHLKTGVFLLLSYAALPIFSQTYGVEGAVTDDLSGLPVPLASVYINGTSQGTITEENGFFRLRYLTLPCELIFSHVSYEPERMILTDTAQLRDMHIRLKRRMIPLQEATIIHQQLRSEYLRKFKRWFLGSDYEALGAELLNDSVLIFNIRENEQFSVDAKAPLWVEISATGYTIRVDLVLFDLRYQEETGGYHCSILGYYFFNPRELRSPHEQRQLARARAEAYYNSPAHFCKSLYHNQLLENGYLFERSCMPASSRVDDRPAAPDFMGSYVTDAYGNEQLLLTRFICRDFQIRYNFNSRNRPVDLTYLQSNPMKVELSGLLFLSDSIYIYPSGRVPENSMLFSGSIGKKGIATMLPEDYIPSMQ